MYVARLLLQWCLIHDGFIPVLVSGAQVVTGSKTFETLTVQDDIVVSGTVGGVDVSDMNDNAVFTSGNQDIAGAKTFGASPTFTDVDFNGKLSLRIACWHIFNYSGRLMQKGAYILFCKTILKKYLYNKIKDNKLNLPHFQALFLS